MNIIHIHIHMIHIHMIHIYTYDTYMYIYNIYMIYIYIYMIYYMYICRCGTFPLIGCFVNTTYMDLTTSSFCWLTRDTLLTYISDRFDHLTPAFPVAMFHSPRTYSISIKSNQQKHTEMAVAIEFFDVFFRLLGSSKRFTAAARTRTPSRKP